MCGSYANPNRCGFRYADNRAHTNTLEKYSQPNGIQPARTASKELPISLESRCSIDTLRSNSVQYSTRTLASQQPKRSSSLSHRFSAPSRHASRLTSAVLPRPGSTAETYVAYGMTQKLFEACSSQADYRIPQVSQTGAEVPKTEGGEDLGVGEGWWHEGMLLLALFSPPQMEEIDICLVSSTLKGRSRG